MNHTKWKKNIPPKEVKLTDTKSFAALIKTLESMTELLNTSLVQKTQELEQAKNALDRIQSSEEKK